MSAFHYVAIDERGKERKGTIEADSEKSARQWLRAHQLMPLTVHLVQRTVIEQRRSRRWRYQRGLTMKGLALMMRQLATLVMAGMPVEEALFAVAEQTESSHVKGLILAVRGYVLDGYTLASALRHYPEAFSTLLCATVAAGERSGHLDRVLLRLTDYTEQQWSMQQKLKTALIYPSMIVLVAIGIVGFLLEYIVPKMMAMYHHLGEELPWLTKVFIAISSGIQKNGIGLLLLFIGGIFIWRRAWKKQEALRKKTHRCLLRTPLIGYAIKMVNTARFARTLAILSSSGVSVLEAMHIAAQLVTALPIRSAVLAAVQQVREGAAIHLALKRTTYFSPMSIHMMASGEASGQLELMLERIAAHQEEEMTRLIDVSFALFEPAMILMMGVIVLFIVLAVLLPLFQLDQLAG